MTTGFPARKLSGAVFVVLCLVAGCSSQKPTASVSGTVSYNGKPQTVGSINLISDTGSGGQAILSENGAFKIEGPLDATEYKVFLQPPVPGQLPPGTKQPPAAKFNLPPKFQQPNSSGVRITLKQGTNDGVVIELKD
ncbi:hypothetical protein GobsT_35180 [Gemmata obscuriglobus]|uniref:Carboxypeptidase regulatory-like domain-containing protein n=1 Tax=Gemmata obscuriglobus TaxID=114 RepID=A0A2Z3H1Y4_9BACT|nr:hypothetical protein [Gemmata obscuriglobus]AWM38352.1 hypothetical protein C1280_16050 [Gemmata obscuriglobus]QEG28732.1 hypothetical protein GobsT_35180 [Gemmata obscuriglobus]VTS07027.1 Uncharacterized protein OS=Planctomyces maris DSM 8797 GN=PM8797T_08484 PE=4 SV=1 [Gemmata obscuriglobus UQM 2246]